jgi:hypothetical protein
MKSPKKVVAGAILALVVLLAGMSVYAQVARQYRNGSVWSVSFIRMKPGMETAYLSYVAGDWKKEQQALKDAGLSLSYKVLRTEGHNTGDWNLLLMTEYKDLATIEANQQKNEALVQKLFGGDEKQQQGYRDRSEIREVMGERIATEVVLEPRR